MDVFQYIDPYMAMQHYYQSRKIQDPKFSYTVWASEMDLQSSSTLRMMVNGKKRISMGLADKFLNIYLKSNDEKNYFRFLVVYAQAGTTQEKSAAWAVLSQILMNRIEQSEVGDYFTFLSDTLLPKIQTILSFDDQVWTEKNLLEALDTNIEELRVALQKLEKIGMAERLDLAGADTCWKSTARLMKVSNKLGDVALKAYHNSSLDEAKAAQNLPVHVRRYKSVILPLNEDEFKSLTDEVDAFAKQLVAKYQSDKYQGRMLYKLNLNYFPVSRGLPNATSKNAG